MGRDNLSSSYISDVVYGSKYNPILNPLNLYLTSVLRGVNAGRLRRSFRYCDLGCGDGTILNMMAALFPDAHFTGIDFNGEHIRTAKAHAQQLDLGNVEFHQLDFKDLPGQEGEPFDFLICFGTFSWINRHLQDSILEYVGRRLAEGGVFLVHYAARPGKIQIDPLWYLLRVIAHEADGSSGERAKKGIDILRRLNESGADFFSQNPLAAKRFGTLVHQDPDYVAHEALTEWQALNHFDVAVRMEKAGLTYLGMSNPAEQDRFVVPVRFESLVDGWDKSSVRQTIIDYTINRGVRSDLYVRTSRSHKVVGAPVPASNIPFGLSSLDRSVQPVWTARNGKEYNFGADPYARILSELQGGARTLEVLAAVFGTASEKELMDAVNILWASGSVCPCLTEFEYEKVAGLPAKVRATNRIVEHALLAKININRPFYLPFVGSGQCLMISPLVALTLSAVLRGPDQGEIDWLLEELNEFDNLPAAGQQVHGSGYREAIRNSYSQMRETAVRYGLETGILGADV